MDRAALIQPFSVSTQNSGRLAGMRLESMLGLNLEQTAVKPFNSVIHLQTPSMELSATSCSLLRQSFALNSQR